MRRLARVTQGSDSTSGAVAPTAGSGLVEGCGTVAIPPKRGHGLHPALLEVEQRFERALEVPVLEIREARVEVGEHPSAGVAAPVLETCHEIEHGPLRDRAVLLLAPAQRAVEEREDLLAAQEPAIELSRVRTGRGAHGWQPWGRTACPVNPCSPMRPIRARRC